MGILDAHLDTAAVQGREGIEAWHPGYPDSMGCPVEDLHADRSRWNSCREEKPRAVSWKPEHKPGVVAFPGALRARCVTPHPNSADVPDHQMGKHKNVTFRTILAISIFVTAQRP